MEFMLDEARQEFAVLFAQSPTLGISAAECRRLPGYIRNKADDVAERIVRRELRHKQSWIVSGGTDDHIAARPSAINSPAEELRYSELMERLENILLEAPPEQRKLVYSRPGSDDTWADTAAALGVSESQAQRFFAKLRARMRESLEPIAERSLCI